MIKKIGAGKTLIISLLFAILTGSVFIHVFVTLFSPYSSTGFINPLDNFTIATLAGMAFSLPFMLGLFGKMYFDRYHKKLALFIAIPTLIVDLIWFVGGGWLDLWIIIVLNTIFALFGISISWVIHKVLR